MSTTLSSERERHVFYLVSGVCLSAALSASLLVAMVPAMPDDAWTALALLTLLAVIGEAWAFLLPQSAVSSIAFIPYSFGKNCIETVILNGEVIDL